MSIILTLSTFLSGLGFVAFLQRDGDDDGDDYGDDDGGGGDCSGNDDETSSRSWQCSPRGKESLLPIPIVVMIIPMD